jgi:choline dehydrogenase-like flavoprotein
VARSVAIVGSGVAAAAIAHVLVRDGFNVTIFEKGPEFPYPHGGQFHERINILYRNPAYELPPDLKTITLTGTYPADIDDERGMVVGGSATHWNAITLRMHPQDFRTRTLFGFGADWPISYDDLEPFYCRAEKFLGVSGTDVDNPYAPRRSNPYPLPPFALGRADRLFAAKLREKGIALHTTPQARTRLPYDGRPACANFGTCHICPIGARYSPNHHLMQAVASGLCTILPNMSVRRVILDSSGRARAIVYRHNDNGTEKEHAADVLIVAAGAIESARLLLLSTDERQPDGIGNEAGHVGRHLTFHHLWIGTMLYRQPVFAGSVGPVTGQTHHFCNPPTRGKHGAVKVEFSSHYVGAFPLPERPGSGVEILEALRKMPNGRGIILHAESALDRRKYVTLSEKRDRFGDPFAHVHYESSDFDRATYEFGRSIYDIFLGATQAESGTLSPVEHFDSGAHHMGTCRMGTGPADSVVDGYGRVYGISNLYLAGSSVFAGTSGAVNPTLTLVALALRTADHIKQTTGSR